MDRGENQPVETAATPRGYSGVRITAPPGRAKTADPAQEKPVVGSLDASGNLVVEPGTQARILTGAALFGVVAIVLLHELGHWVTGFAVTGEVPRFLGVAVQQKVADFSTVGGVLTWGMGPFVHVAVLWGLVLASANRGRRSPRLMAIAGGAAIFTVVANLLIWVGASFSQQDTWGNDIPKVATFFSTAPRLWMHLLSALMMIAILGAAVRWWSSVQATGRPGLIISPTLVGAVEGVVVIVIATFFIELWN